MRDIADAPNQCVDRRAAPSVRPCSCDADCAAGESCFRTSYHDPGNCTRGCIADTDCPGDSYCRPVTRRNATVYICLSASQNAQTRCVSGYSCHVPCREDVPCDDGEVCDNGTCVPAPTLPDAGPTVPDAGPVTSDAGVGLDASTGDDAKDEPRAATFGCPGCAAADLGPVSALGVAGLLALRRRRVAAGGASAQ